MYVLRNLTNQLPLATHRLTPTKHTIQFYRLARMSRDSRPVPFHLLLPFHIYRLAHILSRDSRPVPFQLLLPFQIYRLARMSRDSRPVPSQLLLPFQIYRLARMSRDSRPVSFQLLLPFQIHRLARMSRESRPVPFQLLLPFQIYRLARMSRDSRPEALRPPQHSPLLISSNESLPNVVRLPRLAACLLRSSSSAHLRPLVSTMCLFLEFPVSVLHHPVHEFLSRLSSSSLPFYSFSINPLCRELPLRMCPIQFFCLVLIIFIKNLFLPPFSILLHVSCVLSS